MFQHRNKNIKFRSWMNKYIAFFPKLTFIACLANIFLVREKYKFVLKMIQYRHTYGTKYPSCL